QSYLFCVTIDVLLFTPTLHFDGCCTATLSSAHCQGSPPSLPLLRTCFLFGKFASYASRILVGLIPALPLTV
ncbi:hypothetical protein EDD18DRAFT_1138530, partial [Armillaria luteobubalina]